MRELPVMSTHISSPANPRIKSLVDLRKRRTRDAQRVTLVEGYAELALALDAGVHPQQLFFAPDLVGDAELPLVERAEQAGAEVITLSSAAMQRASYRESSDGWLAVVRSPERPVSEISLGPNPLVLVCEAIEKPGNLGAMVRTAEAAGVDAVIAASAVADWGNPNVIRASKATVFSVPVATASTQDVMQWLRDQHIQIVVATPETDRELGGVNMRLPTAVIVGAEHVGISSAWLKGADVSARLPMAGRVNSLNVATSAAIFIYEALRQRRG